MRTPGTRVLGGGIRRDLNVLLVAPVKDYLGLSQVPWHFPPGGFIASSNLPLEDICQKGMVAGVSALKQSAKNSARSKTVRLRFGSN